jgi:hypothetical protein
MPKGNLRLTITDLKGQPVRSRVEIDLKRESGESGTGGDVMKVSINMGTATDLTITGITCRGGPGTMYRVTATMPHHRPYSFFQLIREATDNSPSDDIEFWVKPGDVKKIDAPGFGALDARLQKILNDADMHVAKPQDEDLKKKKGATLYDALGPLRKACLLNIARKASHATADNCFPDIRELLLCRQDRFFARVDESLPARLRDSLVYKSAPETLHEPLPGFRLAEGSLKSRDAHANLQITFMREIPTGSLAADIDIDESSGIEHGFEVIENAVFNKRTNPYLIREFMLSADFQNHSLDPGYGLVF